MINEPLLYLIVILCFTALGYCARAIQEDKRIANQKYCKRGEYYYRVEETQCGNLIADEKVIQPPFGAEIIEL